MSPDEIVAWFQAHPDLAAETIGRIRVAGPWQVTNHLPSGEVIRLARFQIPHTQTAIGRIEVVSVNLKRLATVMKGDTYIRWFVDSGFGWSSKEHPEPYPNADEAMAAADKLITPEWALMTTPE